MFVLAVGSAYFISLVVVLGVVLEDLGLFSVVEITGEVIEVRFFAPLLTIDKPNDMLEQVVYGGGCRSLHLL
jgi:hypothetical protein